MTAFASGFHVVDLEQFEEELRAGVRHGCLVTLNQTQLFFLVIACQYALKAPDISSASAAILRDIAVDLARRSGFGPETRNFIKTGWE
jgi:hypothetical protein